eukprot:EG_transcript_14919
MAVTYLVVVEEHALPALRAFKRWLEGRPDRLVLYAGLRDPDQDNLAVLEAQDTFRDDRGRWDKVTCIVESNVDPRKRTAELAESLGVDIVVCASNNDTPFLMRSFTWSTSDYALHHCPNHAVLIIHKLQMERECRYLLCIDGSEQSHRAAELLSRLVTAEDVVAVYAAYEPPPVMIAAGRSLMKNLRYEAECQELHTLAMHQIATAKAILEQNNPGLRLNVRGFVEASKSPCKAAIEFAASNNIQIIVCGSRGLSTTQRMVLGSFSTYLAGHATQHAVMVVH